MLDTFVQQLLATTWVEWLGMVTGIAGVWLSIKEKVIAWPFFLVCYGSYTYYGYQFGLKAFVGMNLIFIAISIYGWIKWATARDPSDVALKPSFTAVKHWPFIAIFVIGGTLAVGLLLSNLDNAKLPFLDAFATCCALVAQWMLSRKYIENWIFWVATDVVYLGIFAYGRSWPSVILFTVFIGLAIKGWNEWKRQIA